MWRLIIATFAFLGWSFYSLSGGADYQPREGSRQAEALRLKMDTSTALATAIRKDTIETRALQTVSMNRSELDQGGIAGVSLDKIALYQNASATGQGDDVIRWTATLNLAEPAVTAPLEQIVAASPPVRQEPIRDLRRITGQKVNFRTGPGTRFGVLGKLSRGDEVEVLETFENGWLRLRMMDGQRVGWVSGSLVSDSQG